MQDDVTRGVASLLQWLVVVLIWQILMYGLGYAVLYAGSLGRWPRPQWADRYDDRISATGLALTALAWTLVALYNNGAFA
ncbi:hypothetical protein [Stenotrophomonas sp.]|uniref:hypothetical protein n=1 Tax=Stenotrophomonas sp. TaxID=69392 RepID=UPI002898CC0E|nr:hypothetical protein [Stenotrophomonas sp.]